MPQHLHPQLRKRNWGSFAILFILLLICCGAAYGIWAVLSASSEETDVATPEKVPEPTLAANNPIEQAKATIASIPTVTDEGIVAETDGSQPPPTVNPPVAAATDSPPPASTTTQTLPAPRPVPTQSYTGPAPLGTTQPPSTALSEPVAKQLDYSLKPEVSDYLSSVKIDGYRAGARPKVMLNGKSYLVGDVVQESTGLVFTGTQAQKLLFKDKNGVVYAKSF